MKQILFLFISIGLLNSACSSVKNVKTSGIIQGFKGSLTEISGNQMPMKGIAERKHRALITTLFIYEPTNLTQVKRINNTSFYTDIYTRLVASVISDSTGTFIIHLPVGNYSVFVKQGNDFYANLFDTNNNIALFTVEADKLTTVNLTVNSKATY